MGVNFGGQQVKMHLAKYTLVNSSSMFSYKDANLRCYE